MSNERKDAIFQRLKPVIAETLSVEESIVNLDSRLREDLGADSLDFIDLTMELENEFEVGFLDDAAEYLLTVQNIVDYLETAIQFGQD